MAKSTVESEIVGEADPFASCDVNPGVCDVVRANGYSTPNHCQDINALFRVTYAVWGGWAAPTGGWSSEERTEEITCNIP